MHLFGVATTFTATIALAGAQVVFNTSTSEFICPSGKTAFCAGTSLETNIIIRCNGTFGQPGNCNDNLAGIPPIGVKFAQCYECSPTAGNAACSFQGTVYPDSGSPFSVADGDAHCNSTNTTIPSGAPVNSANVSSTLSYATSAPSLAVSSSASFRNGDAIPIASEAPITTTITSYSTGEVGYEAPKSVTIAPGSGGYNVTGAASGVASSTATSIASSSPIQTFTGAASTDGTPHAMAGAVAVAIAIAAAVL